jgi:SAM-dependent methyltransferase
MTPTGIARSSWLQERLRISEQRYDTVYAASYDRDDPPTSPVHLRFIADLFRHVPTGGSVLDAPCGTGKYFPLVLNAGRNVVGCDQSAGMLAQAAEKFPDVQVRKLSLQDLDYESAFDAVMCIDAIEGISPEDWPLVLSNFHRALRPGGHLYLTVEMTDADWLRKTFADATSRDLPVVPGEDITRGEEYHYYPPLSQVREWLAAGKFTILEEAHSDGAHPSYSYQHFRAASDVSLGI